MGHVDPAQQPVHLKLGKKTYQLVFTFRALALAEAALKKAGEPVNIFAAMDFGNISATAMVSLLYAALVTHHPEVKLDTIPSYITMRRVPAIMEALAEAYVKSMVEADEDDKADPLANQPE